MSQKVRRKKARVKKVTYRDKNRYEIVASKSFNFKPIGEIIGLEHNIVGRTIESLLYDFTGDFKDINLKLKFKVVSFNQESRKCASIFMGHAFTNDFIRSLIGRGSTKITTINNFTTKDGYIFRVTIVCVTIKRARSSQQIIIRKIMREILTEFAKSLNHEKFIRGMIYGEFQNQIKRVAKTIYPLSNSTIIKSKLIFIPEGGEDKEVPDDTFDVVEVPVKRSRKSEIRRSERINVKKLTKGKFVKKEEKTSESTTSEKNSAETKE